MLTYSPIGPPRNLISLKAPPDRLPPPVNPTREAAFAALFALIQTATWNGGTTWAFTDRRICLFKDCPAQPAMFVVSIDDDISQVTGLPYIQTWKANIIIYHNAGTVLANVPQQTDNMIIDAVFKALTPLGPGNKQTLGGLVHHCFIKGTIKKVPGDLDGQSLITIPITMLVP